MINVILVDDHNIVRDGLRAILQKESDIKIIAEAADFQELDKLIKWNLPDVLILDISLPDQSGIEITRAYKKLYPELKILILSMYVNEEFVIGALDSGADGYLPKNTTRRELIDAIHSVYNGEYYFPPHINKMIINKMLGTKLKPSESTEKPDTLSSREKEILKYYAEGFSNKDISEKLFISIRTVESHKNHIMQKLDLKSSVELIKYAIKNKIVNL